MAIKELDTSKFFNLKYIKCRVEDLKYVLALILDSGFSYDKYTLGSYELENIEDLDSMTIESCSNFEVRSKNKDLDESLVVKLDVEKCYVWITNVNDVGLYGLANKVFEYLKTKNRRQLGKKFFFSLYVICVVLISYLIAVSAIDWVSVPAMLLMGYWGFKLMERLNKPIIIINYSKYNSHFLRRNKDNILINSIFFLLGLVIGYLLKYFDKV